MDSKSITNTHTHLVMLQFSSQAVQAVENKLFVQLTVASADKPPNFFSLCFKILPGAQNSLKIMKKYENHQWVHFHAQDAACALTQKQWEL